MKNILFFLFIIQITFISCNNESQENSLIGEWREINSKENPASLILDENKYATFIKGNQVIGGKDISMDDAKYKADCIYEIDYTKKPIWLDLIVILKNEKKDSVRLKGILRFITKDKIEYRLNLTGSRFDGFDFEDKANTLVLERAKK